MTYRFINTEHKHYTIYCRQKKGVQILFFSFFFHNCTISQLMKASQSQNVLLKLNFINTKKKKLLCSFIRKGCVRFRVFKTELCSPQYTQ